MHDEPIRRGSTLAGSPWLTLVAALLSAACFVAARCTSVPQ